MAGFKLNRINEDVLRELTDIVRTLKDPRVNSSMISIVRVSVTNDLSYATAHISSLKGLEGAKEAVEGLESASGFIRRELGLRLKLRHTPKLRFVADDSIEYSMQITKTLKDFNDRNSTEKADLKSEEEEKA